MKDTKKFIIENVKRALFFEKILKEIPVQIFYKPGSEYFQLLEKRNHYLNVVIDTFNNETHIKCDNLRIHQRDAKKVYEKVIEYVGIPKMQRKVG